MKKIYLLLAWFLFFGCIYAHERDSSSFKFIEVTGSAEMEVNPDEITLIIGMGEYWKEEVSGKIFVKNYKTKIPILEVEKNLLSDLQKIGITKEQISITGVGNYWRYEEKESVFDKQLEIRLKDFNQINKIIQTINIKGIRYMMLGQLKNSKITYYRKQVKIKALKAAKTKAGYLLESVGKKVGDIISITELEDENAPLWAPQHMVSNSVVVTPNNSGMGNTRKIKLRYEVKARFEIN